MREIYQRALAILDDNARALAALDSNVSSQYSYYHSRMAYVRFKLVQEGVSQ